MTKKIILFTAMLLSFNAAFAQNFYTKLRGGYGIGSAKEGYYVGLQQGNITATSQENIFESIGRGIPIGLSVGYMLNKNIGFELDGTYLFGDKVKVVDINIPNVSVTLAEAQSNHFRISPNIILSTGTKPFGIYTKVGFVIPLFGYAHVNINNTTNPNSPIFIKQKIEGSPSIGYKGALGTEYEINKRISLFLELEGVHLKIYRKSHEVTEFTINGKNQIDNYEKITGTPKIITYHKKLSGNDLKDNSKKLTTSSPYGKIGFNIGIKINL